MTNNSFFAPFAPKTYKNKKMSIARHLIASFVLWELTDSLLRRPKCVLFGAV